MTKLQKRNPKAPQPDARTYTHHAPAVDEEAAATLPVKEVVQVQTTSKVKRFFKHEGKRTKIANKLKFWGHKKQQKEQEYVDEIKSLTASNIDYCLMSRSVCIDASLQGRSQETQHEVQDTKIYEKQVEEKVGEENLAPKVDERSSEISPEKVHCNETSQDLCDLQQDHEATARKVTNVDENASTHLNIYTQNDVVLSPTNQDEGLDVSSSDDISDLTLSISDVDTEEGGVPIHTPQAASPLHPGSATTASSQPEAKQGSLHLIVRRQRPVQHIDAAASSRNTSNASTLVSVSPTVSTSQVARASSKVDANRGRTYGSLEVGPDQEVLNEEGEVVELRPQGVLRVSPLVESLAEAHEEARAECKLLEVEAATKDGEIEDLKASLDELKVELDQSRSQARSRIQTQSKQLRDGQAAFRTLRNENAALKSTSRQRVADMDALQQTLTQVRQQAAIDRRMALIAGPWCTVKDQVIQCLLGTLEHTDPVMRDVLQGALAKKDEQIKILSEDLGSCVQRCTSAQQDFDRYKADVETKLKRAEKQLDTMTPIAGSALEERDAAMIQYRGLVDWLKGELSTVDVPHQLLIESDFLRTDNQRQKELVAMAQDVGQSSCREVAKKTIELAESSIRLEKLQEKYEDAERERHRLCLENGRLQGTTEVKLETMQQRVDDAEAQFDNMKAHWDAACSGTGSHPAVTELQRMHQSFNNAKEQYVHLLGENRYLQDQLTALDGINRGYEWAYALQGLMEFWRRSGEDVVDMENQPHAPFADGIMKALLREIGVDYESARLDWESRQLGEGAAVIDPRQVPREEPSEEDPAGTARARAMEYYREREWEEEEEFEMF